MANAPAWSPDGSRIVFVTDEDAKAYGVWDIASGKQSLRIPVGTRCTRAAWSPDGTTLALSENHGGSHSPRECLHGKGTPDHSHAETGE